MSVVAIKVEHISKKYLIGESKNYPTLRDKLMELPSRIFKGPKKSEEFWALKDVSFEVKKGEVVGVIGRNGAGKSTLLKILARITEPTQGNITMYGRVASMLEVGTGFNPELTGRENIYLNGAIIGMKKSEITQKFSDIVAFSGVEKFLDTPVKHYSSGMYVRLAFAVAAHLDADILLVDEVLAVGDYEFQRKCLNKMSDLASSGRTIIYVSHNLGSVRSLCTRALLFKDSILLGYGSPNRIIDQYQKRTSNSATLVKFPPNHNNDVTIRAVKIKDNSGRETNEFTSSDLINLEITVDVNKKTQHAEISIGISNAQGINIFFSSFSDSNQGRPANLDRGTYILKTQINQNLLIANRYFLTVTAHYRGLSRIDHHEDLLTFNVTDKNSNLYHYGEAAKSLATVISDFKWEINKK